MNPNTRIFVAGGDTLIGQGLIRRLQDAGHDRLVGVPPREPDLTRRAQVDLFFAKEKPQIVIVVGGPSGGIQANVHRPADLMLNNLLVNAHVIGAAFQHGVEKLLYLGSSCMYPRHAPIPLHPESLGSGPLEPTSQAYATAKLAGMTLCQAFRQQHGAPFIVGIAADVFGPGDDFSTETGHVIPALMARMHEAKTRDRPFVEIWGTGAPVREFLYVRDLADACLFALTHYDEGEPINLGGGTECSIAEVAQLIATVVDYRGELRFDPGRPDGMPRKMLDSRKLIDLGWQPATPFQDALRESYAWFLENLSGR